MTQELRDRLSAAFPTGRVGRPEDIAGIVAWLLSADCGWLTGQVIDAEGGYRGGERPIPPAIRPPGDG